MTGEAAALVTGAGSGIGRATALRLAAGGLPVLAADRDLAGAQATAALAGGGIVPFRCDVRREEEVSEMMLRATELGRLSVLVNVAGVGATGTAPETTSDDWDRVHEVNVRGTFLACKHAVPYMAKSGGGSIVNVASVAGLVGLPRRAAYCASKGAVVALTRALAIDHVGQGIRVNCVCPGTVDTPWVRRLVEEAGESIDALRARQPMGRLGSADEVAAAIEYLVDSRAAFVTGSALVIDGGLTAG